MIKHIFTTWCGYDTPQLNDYMLESIKECFPDFTFHCYTRKDPIFALLYDYPVIKEYENRNMWAYMSDILRVIIGYEVGGVYCDNDVEFFKRTEYEDEFVACFEDYNSIGAHLYVTQPYNRIGKNILDYYRELEFHEPIKDFIAPAVLWKIFNREVSSNKLTTASDTIGIKGKDFRLLSMEYWTPYFVSDKSIKDSKFTDKTEAMHYFNGTWLKHPNKHYRDLKNKINELRRLRHERYSK